MKIKSFALLVFILTALTQTTLCFSADRISSSDKKASVTLVVRDGDGKEIARDTAAVVDRDGVVVTTPSLVSSWLRSVDYAITAETQTGDLLPVENVLAINKRLGLAVLAVKGHDLPWSRVPGDERMAFIQAQIARFRKIKAAEKPRESQPAPAVHPSAPPKKEEPSPVACEEQEKKGTAAAKPDDAQVHFILGKAHHTVKGYDDAIDEYMTVLKLKPDHVEALIRLGMLYCETGMYNEAIREYRKAIQVRPDAVEAYNKLGTVYIIREEYGEAIASFRKALEIDPTDVNAYYGAGMAYFMAGDKNSAMEQYIILNKLDKKRANELFDLVFR
ncbi:MAG: tetratricopeptide repeat protein [Nitrospirales bacterium]|nr:tetratricopeptide repeat protein [Nitrospirales bacterium]